jgi:hypothetical protein
MLDMFFLIVDLSIVSFGLFVSELVHGRFVTQFHLYKGAHYNPNKIMADIRKSDA